MTVRYATKRLICVVWTVGYTVGPDGRATITYHAPDGPHADRQSERALPRFSLVEDADRTVRKLVVAPAQHAFDHWAKPDHPGAVVYDVANPHHVFDYPRDAGVAAKEQPA